MSTTTTAREALATRTERLRAGSTDRLEASLIGAGPHLEAVLDVGTTEQGDLLLVLPLPAARLADLLAVPGWPTAGEAVTVLVPLAQALARLHRAGVALAAAGAESVVLDADGAPLWRVPPEPVLLRRAGAAAFSSAVDADRERFAGFAVALVARTGRHLAAPADADPEALADALFDLAEPCAVRLDPIAAVDDHDLPARLVAPAPDGPRVRVRGGRGRRARTLLEQGLRAAAPLRTVRRRVWAMAACAVAGLLLAVALLPGAHDDAVGDAPAPRPPTRASPTAGPARALAGPVAPRRLRGRTAVLRLLAARARCATSTTGDCLATVDAAGSPVDVADRRSVHAGVELVSPDAGRLRVLSEGGGTVLTDAGGTVVVAVRQADGWRLRDIVAEPPR